MTHPYHQQPDKAFWRKTVSSDLPDCFTEPLYTKKFDIADKTLATAGSCFAQHIGRFLKEKHFNYIDMEPPHLYLKSQNWSRYGYGLFSARYGNIYSSRQLLQLFQRAFNQFTPQETVWQKQGRFIDPFRPTVEPDGFDTFDEVITSRDYHLDCVRRLFLNTRILIFTLGLTEIWVSKADGAVFPVPPGTSAGGQFDPGRYEMINLSYHDVLSDMQKLFKRLRNINPDISFILTVSPVPLVATAENEHVIVANSYSKSVLRAVAGYLYKQHDFVDYFPSYEIISSHISQGRHYSPDMRTVRQASVDQVMQHFMSQHISANMKNLSAPAHVPTKAESAIAADDAVCDELLNEITP